MVLSIADLFIVRGEGIDKVRYAIFDNTTWKYIMFGYSDAIPFRCVFEPIYAELSTIDLSIYLTSDAGRPITYFFKRGYYDLYINVEKKPYYYHYNNWVSGISSVIPLIFLPNNKYDGYKVEIGEKTLSLSKQRSLLTIVPSMMSNLI